MNLIDWLRRKKQHEAKKKEMGQRTWLERRALGIKTDERPPKDIEREMMAQVFRLNLLVREARLAGIVVNFHVYTRTEGIPWRDGVRQIGANMQRSL